ncbi:MAG: RCC1 domain-containing protein [Nannocystaceae bacterium]|nr:RCC1 domain-containing protein [bacterium]
MRLAYFVFIANLSICATAPSTTDEPASPSVPKLKRELAVSLQQRTAGEPVALVGGSEMLCAIRKDAPAACIGEIGLPLAAADRTLDDGRYSRTHAELPVAIADLNLRGLDATDPYIRCTLDPEKGRVRCWWRDLAARRGNLPKELPARDVVDIAADSQVCTVDKSGTVRCTGGATCFGEHDPEYDQNRPIDVPAVGAARRVSKGIHMGCVVRTDSTVACWGKTARGQCNPSAVAVPDLRDVVDIATGDYSACALRADNRVFCWGDNGRAELGDPGASFATTPIEVPLAHPAVKLRSAGRGFVALRADGSVVGWGHSVFGDRNTPPAKLKFKRPAVDFVAMRGLVCALLDTGSVECDGYKVRFAEAEGRPRPPFEGKEPWVNAPLYRLAAEPSG